MAMAALLIFVKCSVEMSMSDNSITARMMSVMIDQTFGVRWQKYEIILILPSFYGIFYRTKAKIELFLPKESLPVAM